jgi:hypothetical protein
VGTSWEVWYYGTVENSDMVMDDCISLFQIYMYAMYTFQLLPSSLSPYCCTQTHHLFVQLLSPLLQVLLALWGRQVIRMDRSLSRR